jgi:hypothetical protein
LLRGDAHLVGGRLADALGWRDRGRILERHEIPVMCKIPEMQKEADKRKTPDRHKAVSLR